MCLGNTLLHFLSKRVGSSYIWDGEATKVLGDMKDCMSKLPAVSLSLFSS